MRILKSQSILRLANSYLIDSPQPANISYLWNFGSLLGLCLVIQILTGVFLAMHYTPHIDLAFNSVEHIISLYMRDVNAGYILRYTHANVASFFFIFVYAQMRLFYSSYKTPRTLVWTIGVIIFIVMIATAFLGYKDSPKWITNLLSAIPFFGQDLVESNYSFATVFLTTCGNTIVKNTGLVVAHFIALHVHGSNNPIGISNNGDRIPMHPYFVFKDLITVFTFFLVLSIMVFYYPNVLGHSDNYIPANPMSTPSSIVPEWYLLPFYAILRSIPNKLLGVIAMFGSLLILLVLPITDLSVIRGSQFRPLMKLAHWFFIVNFFILMWIGACHPTTPYLEIGQVATIFYFSWFLIIVPSIGVIENTAFEVATEKKYQFSK
uniref:Cytochrome b n=1 Tax=Sanghuangporus vaninii TaxID=175686 RepID=A0A7H1DSJ4_9AGAM|nr:cytochrome b [Sanghuangporus vaninii]QNS39952.1 cytochrome b [Sanghuangporus vaninii]